MHQGEAQKTIRHVCSVWHNDAAVRLCALMGIAFLFVFSFLHCLFVPEASFVAAFPDPHFPVPRPAHFLQQHFWVLDVLYCIVSPVFLTAYPRLLVSAGWLDTAGWCQQCTTSSCC